VTGLLLLALIIVALTALGARVCELNAQVDQERRNRLSDRASYQYAIETLAAALEDYDDLAADVTALQREQGAGKTASGTCGNAAGRRR
jgi:uncharacterized membrane protein